ncbi:MAG: tetratricopeptide repeat protein [Tannerellaceae bacterium]|nr:tetratricopeptide repeat protein [Tannerellaceae bacterium]
MKTILYLLFSFSFLFSACTKKENLSPELQEAESLMRAYPDSAWTILKNMTVPDPMNQEEYATYCLLLVQARDKNYETHTSDSLINIAIDYFSGKGDPLRKAWSLYYGGRVYSDLRNTPQAAFHYLQAKEVADKTTDYNLRALVSTNLGSLYRELTFYEESLELKRQSLIYNKLENDTIGCMYSLRDIGLEYKLTEQYDSALWYYKEALNYLDIVDNKEIQNIIHVGIANVYLCQELYDEVIYYVKNNVTINKYNLDAISFLLGESFLYINELDSALYYLNIAEKSSYIYMKAAAYKTLHDVYIKKENYKEALYNNEMYVHCLDSVQAFKQTNVVKEIQAKVDFMNLINIGEQLKYQKATQDKGYSYFVVFILLTIVLSYFLYQYIKRDREKKIIHIKKLIQRNKLKLKENRFVIEQNIELLSEKELQLIKNEVRQNQVQSLIQENEILKAEIDDQEKLFSILLQKNSHSFFKKNEELIYKYNKLKEKESKLLSYIVKEDSLLRRLKNCCKTSDPFPKKDFNQIVDRVNELYDGFANRLLISYPNLTKDDIVVCCLLKIQLTPTEIAILTDSMPDAIYKRKQRIKERINCNSNSSLDEFIYIF